MPPPTLLHLLLLGSLITIQGSDVDPENEQKIRIWVYFKTKHDPLDSRTIDDRMESLKLSMDPRVLQRRAKTRVAEPLIDDRDLPVSERFVRDVLALPSVRLRATSRWLNAISIETPQKNVATISALPCVERVEPVKKVWFHKGWMEEPEISLEEVEKRDENDIYGASRPQLEQINVIMAHEAGFNGTGARVLVMDAGFRITHESTPVIIETYDFVNDEVTVQEGSVSEDGHGTGTLSQAGGRYDGTFRGVAFGAQFYLAR